jgi:tripartite-type tricarboxylate transporter receptor subunit TctC
VPTVQESGVPGYKVALWNALAAPAGTPPRVIETLNAAIRDAVNRPDVQQRLQTLGVRAPGSTPAELSPAAEFRDAALEAGDRQRQDPPAVTAVAATFRHSKDTHA